MRNKADAEILYQSYLLFGNIRRGCCNGNNEIGKGDWRGMTNTEFFTAVRDEVFEILHKQGLVLEVVLQEVAKTNNVVHHALVIKSDINIAPVIYMDWYYDRYLNGEIGLKESAEMIANLYNSNRCEMDFDINFICEFEKIKDRIIVSIYNTDKNAKKLLEIPHKQFEDLSIYYIIDIPMQERGTGSVVVNNHLLAIWGKTVDEIDEIAWQNMKRIYPAAFKSMSEIMGNVCSDDELEAVCEDSHMYVLSCANKINGAVYMADTNELLRICEKLNDDVCVLPSSRHEVIIIPAKFVSESDYAHLKLMVCEINATQVAQEDFLSDSVYFFERATKTLKLVA